MTVSKAKHRLNYMTGPDKTDPQGTYSWRQTITEVCLVRISQVLKLGQKAAVYIDLYGFISLLITKVTMDF